MTSETSTVKIDWRYLEAALQVDPRCLRFGPHAVVIPWGPFMERIKQTARSQSLRLRAGLVRYYDDEVFNGEFKLKDVPFRKQKRFDYQREFRICVQSFSPLTDAPHLQHRISAWARRLHAVGTRAQGVRAIFGGQSCLAPFAPFGAQNATIRLPVLNRKGQSDRHRDQFTTRPSSGTETCLGEA